MANPPAALLSYILPLFLPRWWPSQETGSAGQSTSHDHDRAAVNDAHQHQQQAAAVEAEESMLVGLGQDPDLEAGHLPPGHQASEENDDTEERLPAGENAHQEPTELKQYLTYSFLIFSLATGILTNLFLIRRAEEPLSKNPSLIVACASAVTSLVSACGLMFNTMKQMASSPRQQTRDSPCSFSKLFFFISTLSLAFTMLSIMVSFLPKAYYYLPIVLVPALPVIVISFYGRRRRRRDAAITLGDNDPHRDERERSYQLTMSMLGFSFAGALGTIIGYHKNYSNRAGHVYVNLSIYLMLGAAVTCLLLILLQSRLQGRNEDWKKSAVGNAIALALLVLAVLIVAATFLGPVLATTPLPVGVAGAIWYVVEYSIVPPGDLNAAFSREEERKMMYTGAVTAMSLSFSAVMTTFAGFLGGQDKGVLLEIFIFFVVSCFISSVSLGVITFGAPKKASVAAAAMALACFTMVLLVLAALSMVSYVG